MMIVTINDNISKDSGKAILLTPEETWFNKHAMPRPKYAGIYG